MRPDLLLKTVAATLTTAAFGAAPSSPPTKGLVLWLDASDAASFRTDADGRVLQWSDKSPAGSHAKPPAGPGPARLAEGINGRPAVLFSGKEYLTVPRLADGRGNLTVFVVFERREEQASPQKWQRLLSCWDRKSKGDNKAPSFQMCTREGDPVPATIRYELLSNRHRGEMWIGANMQGPHQFLRGSIAEVLVYDHGFLVDEQIQRVSRYLRAKWGIPEKPDEAWTRIGILPDPPARGSNRLPLSDQANAGRWTPHTPMWDEFEGERLDASKWWDHNPRWYGRPPSRYLGEEQNVAVSDGMMHIAMKRDNSLPREQFYRNGQEYHGYSAGSVVSKQPVLYGYFEIRARAMNSAGSSAFWFSSRMKDLATGKPYRSEIDVFEIGGGAPDHDTLFHMNAHIFETPGDGAKHWSKGGTWEAPFRFADAHHVFGLHWAPGFIRYSVDGVEVRRMKNTHWHAPMFLIFDSETMGNWLGMPRDEDLPSTFSVEYVRAWKNADTPGDWQQTFETYRDPTEPTKITRYIRSMDGHGK